VGVTESRVLAEVTPERYQELWAHAQRMLVRIERVRQTRRAREVFRDHARGAVVVAVGLPRPRGGGRPPKITCAYCGGQVNPRTARLARVRGVHSYVCGHHPVRRGE